MTPSIWRAGALGAGAVMLGAVVSGLPLAAAGGSFAPRGNTGLADAVTAAGSGVDVAIVVDYGLGSGISPRIIEKCLRVAAGTNGAQVLEDLAQAIGKPPPTYNASGLLCAIGGYPASGCGVQTGSGYYYWSYWHGSGASWSYATAGPGTWAVHSGDVEGWRYENPGSGNPTDPPPAAPASYASICPTVTPTTPVPAPAAPSNASPQAPAPSVGSTPGQQGAIGSSSPPGTAISPAHPGGQPPTTDAKAPASSTMKAPALRPPSTTTLHSAASNDGTGSKHQALALGASAAAGHHGGGGGAGGLVALVVSLVVAGGLGVAAYLRWRRRPASP